MQGLDLVDIELLEPDLICRDEACQRLEIHAANSGCCIRKPERDSDFRTKSKIYRGTPWRAHCHDALRESVYRSISAVEPRNFATIVSMVENDYGSCCDRTILRHLGFLKSFGKIVRMDFKGRIYAYLRAGSRLVNDPGLVFEQMLDLHGAEVV
jgi:hypothetical protein